MDYEQIAQDCKNKLIAWRGRTIILPHEWHILKQHNFPFDLNLKPTHYLIDVVREYISVVDIRHLDSAPLVKLLEKRFGPIQNVSPTDINLIMDYAWSRILTSATYVWGG